MNRQGVSWKEKGSSKERASRGRRAVSKYHTSCWE